MATGLGVAGLLLVLSGCGGGDDGGSGPAADAAPAGDAAVEIVDFAFEPREIRVEPGASVRWTNRDGVAHTVRDQSDLGVAESSNLAEGDSFEIAYDEPGSYAYICGIHQYMTGTVVVEG